MLKNFLVSWLFFLGLDFLWLKLIAKGFYDQSLSAFKRGFNLWSAIAVYLLLSLGLVLFVFPQLKGLDHLKKFCLGSIFGLVVYGIYDLTNLAILADWSLKITIVDISWGMFVCGTVTLLTSLILGF